jgi:hypothetical protein
MPSGDEVLNSSVSFQLFIMPSGDEVLNSSVSFQLFIMPYEAG